MKFKANREVLIGLLSKVTKAVPKSHNILPIYQNLRFDIKDGICTVTGGNNHLQIQAQARVESKEDFSFCTLDRHFTRTIGGLSEEEVNVEIKEYKNVGKKVVISAGKSKKYKIPVENHDNYSIISLKDEVKECEINSKEFLYSINSAFRCTDPKDIRPFCTGAVLDHKDGVLNVKGTNGNIMYGDDPKSNKGDDFEILVPRIMGDMIMDVKDDGITKIRTDDNMVSFSIPGFRIMCRLVEAKIPDTQVFFDNIPNSYLKINKVDFLSTLRRINVFTIGNLINLDIDGNKMIVSADNVDMGVSGEEELEVENIGVDLDGAKICLNYNYISEPLLRITDEFVYFYLQAIDKQVTVMPKEKEVSKTHWMVMPSVATVKKQ